MIKKKSVFNRLKRNLFHITIKKCKVKGGIKKIVLKCFEILRFHTPLK